jgi:nucleoside-diphosphate-sugar epimerase
MSRRLLITGAGGFLGRALVRRLAAEPELAGASLTLVDLRLKEGPTTARLIEGDIASSETLERALAEAPDVIFHLAALPGGAAEADPEASRRINLDASLALFERLAAQGGRPPRLVYASSIAVFGAPLPASVDDATSPRPAMTYGAHKLMIETALADWTRRGGLSGLALRLPGIVARPRQGAGFRSAFLSDIFHALAAREAITLPAGPEGMSWMLSLSACVENLLHAARLQAGAGTPPTVNLPALRVRIADLAGEIARQTGAPEGLVRYAPDPAIESQFASYPPLATPAADALGFRHDGDLAGLVRQALADLSRPAEEAPS